MECFAQRECGPLCQSHQHAAELTTCVTKGSLNQVKIFLSTCHNVLGGVDHYGRNILHLAASCGRIDVIEWLLQNSTTVADVAAIKIALNLKDGESEWTPLHRSFFYGHLHAARLLIEHGADMHILDKDGYSPLDLAVKDNVCSNTYRFTDPCTVYTWGNDNNNILGTNKSKAAIVPEAMNQFRKRHIHIKQVELSKYHSVFLTYDGQVYTCGQGYGGKLGLGHENSVMTPQLVTHLSKDVKCKRISAGLNHTLMLMDNNTVYACGLNDNHQLGLAVKQFSKISIPKPIAVEWVDKFVAQITGMRAQQYHSVIYSRSAMYTFGLNIGQIGHMKSERTVHRPRIVPSFSRPGNIKSVITSDAATVVISTGGDVFILNNFKTTQITARWRDLVHVTMAGGSYDSSLLNSNMQYKNQMSGLIVGLLTITGQVFVWRESVSSMFHYEWDIGRQLHVIDLCIQQYTMTYVTSDGQGYCCKLPQKVRPPSANNALKNPSRKRIKSLKCFKPDQCDYLDIKRIPMLHRAVRVTMDVDAVSFAALQNLPDSRLDCYPAVSDSVMFDDMLTLYTECLTENSTHSDVVLQVGCRQFYGHRCILASRSEYFNDLLMNTEPECILELTDISDRDVDIFLDLLMFIYTNHCTLYDNAVVQYDPEMTEDDRISPLIPLRDTKFHRLDDTSQYKRYYIMAHDLKLYQFCQSLTHVYTMQKLNSTNCRVPNTVRFDRIRCNSSYDIEITSSDGVTFGAHQCLLTSRVEYFRMMLCNVWTESVDGCLTIELPSDLLEVLLQYIYCDRDVNLIEYKLEMLCNILVMADQFLINRLKEQCEVVIAKLLSIQNVCELCEFAHMYRAPQLLNICISFIIKNVTSIAENRNWKVLGDDVMKLLSTRYREKISTVGNRLITPHSGWPTREYLEHLEKLELSKLRDESESENELHEDCIEMNNEHITESVDCDSPKSASDKELEDINDCVYDISLEDDSGIVKNCIDKVTTDGKCIRSVSSLYAAKPKHRTKKKKRKNSTKIEIDEQPIQEDEVTKASPAKLWGTIETVTDIHDFSMEVKPANKPTLALPSEKQKPRVRVSSKDGKTITWGLSNGRTVSNQSILSEPLPHKETPPLSTPKMTPPPVVNPWGVCSKSPDVADPGVIMKEEECRQMRNSDRYDRNTLSQSPSGNAVCSPHVYSPGTHKTRFRVSSKDDTTTGQSSRGQFASPNFPNIPKSTKPKGAITTPSTPPTINPWGPLVHSPDAKSTTPETLHDIMNEEKEKEAEYQKYAKKTLPQIQLEERAINELLQHYTASECAETYITIERMPKVTADPIWDANVNYRGTTNR